MTYKYQYIRRELYETNPAGKLNSYRSLKVMVRMFRLPLWIILITIITSASFIMAFNILNISGPIIWLPIIVMTFASIMSQILREKNFYNEFIRSHELAEKKKYYEEYISDVWMILQNYGIDNSEKLKILKSECEKALEARKNRFAQINNKIIDMLIGVPLGALIASIIYADNDAIPATIVTLILIGFAILGVVKIIESINYYSEGYFKDKYLLDAINELIYSEKPGQPYISTRDKSQ